MMEGRKWMWPRMAAIYEITLPSGEVIRKRSYAVRDDNALATVYTRNGQTHADLWPRRIIAGQLYLNAQRVR